MAVCLQSVADTLSLPRPTEESSRSSPVAVLRGHTHGQIRGDQLGNTKMHTHTYTVFSVR